MPYKLVKSGSGWKVAKKDGSKTFSKDPMSRERAAAQMRALYANSNEGFAGHLNAIIEGQIPDLESDMAPGTPLASDLSGMCEHLAELIQSSQTDTSPFLIEARRQLQLALSAIHAQATA